MSGSLQELVAQLRANPGLFAKRDIQLAASILPAAGTGAFLQDATAAVRNGDDAAAIPDGDGYMLVAAEGMLGDFVRRDPFFAGFSAVMVNVNDILAMGGKPYAIVDVLFSGDRQRDEQLLAGLQAGSQRFGVPIVGGHTGRSSSGETALAVAIVGRARRLITSFDAAPGDLLLVAVDTRGNYRADSDYYDAASSATTGPLLSQARVLPQLAEGGLVRAGKDVSMSSFAGTLVMLCETSGVGASMDLLRLPRPADVSLARWLRTFPSFAFLLAAPAAVAADVCQAFERVGVCCSVAGHFGDGPEVCLSMGEQRATLWDPSRERLTGFGGFSSN